MRRSFIILIVFSALLGGFLGAVFKAEFADANLIKDFWNKLVPLDLPEGRLPDEAPTVKAPTTPPPIYAPTIDYEQAVVKAVEEASPSVVSVIVSKDLPKIEQCSYNPFGDLPPEFRQFFGSPFEFYRPCQNGTERKEVGGGSGFVVGDGLILTNKHVVNDTKAGYTVLTNDGKKYDAKVLALDPVLDLAILKVEVSGLKKLKLGDSDSIKLGQTAIAIGNSLGEFRNTVSAGVISGLSRNVTAQGGGMIERIEGVIQTDAAINPGNSGGPLLNLKGEVIGINTAIASGAENIGFALPINQAKRAIQSVEKTGRIVIPYLGVRYINITEAGAEKEKLPAKYGALVRGSEDGPAVMKDSPAGKAGVQTEDIILELNGVKIDEDHSLGALIQRYNVGDEISLRVLREGNQITLKAILEERKF